MIGAGPSPHAPYVTGWPGVPERTRSCPRQTPPRLKSTVAPGASSSAFTSSSVVPSSIRYTRSDGARA